MNFPINSQQMTNETKMLGCAGHDDVSVSSATSNKSADFDNVEPNDSVSDDDEFNGEGVLRPRSDSSNSQFVLEKTKRNSGFGSKDPLFQGVYLHEGTMTTEQLKAYKSRFCNGSTLSKINGGSINRKVRNQSPGRNSVPWTVSFLSIFSSNN